MHKIIFLSGFTVIALLVSFNFGNDKQRRNIISYTDAQFQNFNISRNEYYTSSTLVNPPQDTVPYLSTYVDYATNGASLSQLLFMHDTILASCTYVDSLGARNPNSSNSLTTIYNYSINNGVTWEYSVSMTFDRKSRFGDMNMRYIPYAVPTVTGRFWNPPLNSSVRRAGGSFDVIIGAGSPTVSLLEGTAGTDLFSSIRVDGKIACVVQTPSFTSLSIDSIFYTTYNVNGAFGVFSPLRVVKTTPLVNNSCSYTIAASPIDSNHISIAYCFINEPLTSGASSVPVIRVQTSTNAGLNWNAPILVNPNGFINGDSAQAFWHEDLAYKPGTNIPYLVFSTTDNSIENDPNIYRKNYKICIWSQALNGGVPVVIADWNNIPVLNNVSLFLRINNFHVNSRVLNHPCLSFKNDGSRMFVVYSVCQPETSFSAFNYEDVFWQYSDDGGNTWSIPINLTNTTNQVEKYPVTPKVFTNNFPPVMYQWDLVPGSHSFNDLVPINRVYWVLKSDVLTSISFTESEIPSHFSLSQNYPNPFNPTTKIKFAIPHSAFTKLAVYDVLGREVKILVNEELSSGTYEIDFNGVDFPSGIYFYKLIARDFSKTGKMVLIK